MDLLKNKAKKLKKFQLKKRGVSLKEIIIKMKS